MKYTRKRMLSPRTGKPKMQLIASTNIVKNYILKQLYSPKYN
jgi:hypothetical protein